MERWILRRRLGQSRFTSQTGLVRAEPRGLQRGVETRIKLTGAISPPLRVSRFITQNCRELLPDPDPNPIEAWIRVTAASDLRRGAYEISVEAQVARAENQTARR